MVNKKGCILLVFILLLFSGFALAHEDERSGINIGEYLSGLSVNIILIASVIIIVLVIISIHYEKKVKKVKKLLFVGIVIPIIIASIFLAGSTIYVNLISETKGPVHWHADFEIWNCGEKVDIIDPSGLSNREGSSTFHEHGDDRIHVEGVVVDSGDVDLHSFFKVIGGKLGNEELIVSTNDGILALKNGDLCDGKSGRLQVFLYKIINPDPNKKSGFVYQQEKLDDFEDYVLSPYSNIPPGDCIIVEFDGEKERTDNICETYKIAIEKGDLSGG